MKKIFVILFYIITLPIFSKDFLVGRSSFSEKQIDEINNIVSKKFETFIEKGVASKADIIQSENKLLIILGGGGFGLALLILFYLSSRIDKLDSKIDDGLKETDKKIERLDSKIDNGLNKLNNKIDDGLKETNKKIERLDSKIDDGLNKIYDILLKDRIK